MKKIILIIQDNLSEAAQEIKKDPESARQRICFVKWLVSHYKKEMDREIEEQKAIGYFKTL